EGEERHRKRMRSAEERGQGRQGEDGVSPQAGDDSRGPAGIEREHAQTGGALAERTSRAEERIGGEEEQYAEKLAGTRLPAGNEHQRRKSDQQIDDAGHGAAAEVGGRVTRRLSSLQGPASCTAKSAARSRRARTSLWGLQGDRS